MNKFPLFSKGKTGQISFKTSSQSHLYFWLYGLIIFLVVCFFILFLRLFQLTIVKGRYYRQLSEENRMRVLLIEAPRGKIIDRKNLIIAKNLEADTSKNDLRLKSLRLYQDPLAVAPVIGYLQLADKEDLKNDSCLSKLKLGDQIGKKGIEKIFDCDLRGKHGKKIVEVDAQGKYLKTLTIIPPSSGKTVQLALDLELQQKAYQLLAGKKGAVVGIKPKTGEVLIMISTPSYHPQKIVEALTDKDKPLFNRATEGIYPPGSIFKLVVAAGALEEKVIDEKTQVEDTGIIQAGPITFGNWYYLQYGRTEGMVDVVKAIRRSNDIFFYKAGERLGVEKIKIWAERFGYGKKHTLGLEESTGLIPSPFWKEETYGEHWYLGDTYNLSIGQGYVLVTPLQVTLATASVANGGYLCPPKLQKIRNSFTREGKFEIRNCDKVPVSQKTLSLVKEGMEKACTTGGTGWPFFEFKPPVACKTGTAESHGESKNPHAWFTAYAPVENPEIVLTVLIEEGGQGSDIAGPVAKEILKTYFERKE